MRPLDRFGRWAVSINDEALSSAFGIEDGPTKDPSTPTSRSDSRRTWLIASRRDEWEELLAATFVTVALAIPLLVGAAFLEVYVWPDVLRAVSPIY